MKGGVVAVGEGVDTEKSSVLEVGDETWRLVTPRRVGKDIV